MHEKQYKRSSHLKQSVWRLRIILGLLWLLTAVWFVIGVFVLVGLPG